MLTYTIKMLNRITLFKYLSKLLPIVAVILFTGTAVQAQRMVNVEPGLGTLNVAIDSDTTETGARVDSNTVYVLERGGFYALEGSIQNRGYHLSIVAEDGEGDMPMLVPAAGDGGVSSRPFRARGDLTLRGLYVTGEDNTGNLNEDLRIIRVSENDVTIRIDQSHLDKDGQAAFRIDNSGNRIFITNSTISNIGTTASLDNGRVIDDRGSQIDTLVMENNTFYNITSQVLRDAGGEINYARVNHNTVVNIGKNGAFEFGQAVDVTFTNNLIINGAFLGRPASEMEAESLYVVSIDALSQTQIDSLGEASVTISNNNIYRDASLEEAYPDTVLAAVDFNANAMTYIEAGETGSTLISESVDFTNGPGIPTDVVTSFYETPDATQPPMPVEGEPFDFEYAASFDSYTAGTSGQQLGSLMWHGGMTVSNEREGIAETPSGFKLNGNYPNPFNPTTNISFSLPQAATVSVDVFSVIGQKVLSIPAQRMSAGTNQNIRVDASSLTSGMYIYRVKANLGNSTFMKTGRMTLIK